MTLIEQLEYDIPRAEERLGSDARIVRQMRRQLEGIKAESQNQRNLSRISDKITQRGA